MRRIAAIAFLALALPLAAQDRPKLEPLPEPPPPAPGFNFDAATDQPVTIQKNKKQSIEETTSPAGKKKIRVTNPDGSSYEMHEDRGDESAAGKPPLDTGLRVPLWTIYSF